MTIFCRTRNEEMVLADMHIKPGEAWDYCPKEALKRVTKILKDEFGMVCQNIQCEYGEDSILCCVICSHRVKPFMQVMNAGFENEFYLLRKMTRYADHVHDCVPSISALTFQAVN